ncbi:hypothetical protein MLD38_006964 [Melastoma candidum]|uniref:Uncharacterized protein n=1 Tax=Melastoma candidum TaxID=119954 RepID=A0ACB9RP86_9MYRT|nr:hypothetical protein MLD38_006964 [Melastoma candidum]
MVKFSKREKSVESQEMVPTSGSEIKFRGVRKRKWGKYVSEIRLPNSRERIWLGSYDSAKKAARAFDAALFLLRGRKAKFNFPNSVPHQVGEGGAGSRLTNSEIQEAASRFANSDSESSSSGGYPSSSHRSSLQATDSECTAELDGPLREDARDCYLDDPIDFGIFPGIEEFPSEFFGMETGMESSGTVGDDDGGLSFDEFFIGSGDHFLWSY